MKKQLRFLTLMFLGILFGIVESSGQVDPVSCYTPKPIVATCLDLDDGLNPVAGVEYTYTVDVPTPPGAKYFTWFVTKEPDFITGSILNTADAEQLASTPLILSAGTHYLTKSLDDGTTQFESIEITWNYFVPDPDAPVFLVVHVSNEADCDNDNIEVFIIEPVHSFTLDIAALDENGTTIDKDGVLSPTTETFVYPCAAPIASAVWDNTDKEIKMNYGINYLYFTVTAANFNHSWMPSFEVTGDGIDGDPLSRKPTAIEWRNLGTTSPWIGSGVPAWDGAAYASTSTSPVLPQTTGATAVGAAGECIVIRVTIDNGFIETIDTDDVVRLAVDGVMYDSTDGLTDRYATASLGDVHHDDHPSDPTNNCLWVDLFVNDYAIHNITVRPDIDEVTPDPFEDKEGQED